MILRLGLAASLAWGQSAPTASQTRIEADGAIVLTAADPRVDGRLELTFEAPRPGAPGRLTRARLVKSGGASPVEGEGSVDGNVAEGSLRLPGAAAATAFRITVAAPRVEREGATRAQRALDRMSVEQRIGQVMMVAIDQELAPRYEDDIRAGRLGGGLLRWDKFSGSQAREFSDRMQSWASGGEGRPGFLVAADHEGGPVFTQRSYGATIFPGNMALGATGSEDYARRAARATAEELRALGIHMTFAPVLDVNSNPSNPIIGVRSFGEVPSEVARLGGAAVRGYEDGGILAVAKHYPGHGDTETDSHRKLPVIHKTIEALRGVDLAPFKAAIDAGLSAMMPAHILFPALDADLPVTLSQKAIAGLRSLGFDGLIVSDSMDMAAISESYGSGDAAVRAIQAGVDLLLLGKGDYRAIYDAVLAAAFDGRIAPQRLDDAARRVLAAKEKAGLLGGPQAARPALEVVGRPEHQALAEEIAGQAITLVRDADGLIPLRPRADQKLLVLAMHAGRHEAELSGFFAELAARHPNVEARLLAHKPDEAAVAGAVGAAETADLVVVGTYDWGAAGFVEQEVLVQRILATGKPVVLASLMNPYDLRKFPGIRTAVATYGITPASMRALARVLFGEIPANGRLPVTIPYRAG